METEILFGYTILYLRIHFQKDCSEQQDQPLTIGTETALLNNQKVRIFNGDPSQCSGSQHLRKR